MGVVTVATVTDDAHNRHFVSNRLSANKINNLAFVIGMNMKISRGAAGRTGLGFGFYILHETVKEIF